MLDKYAADMIARGDAKKKEEQRRADAMQKMLSTDPTVMWERYKALKPGAKDNINGFGVKYVHGPEGLTPEMDLEPARPNKGKGKGKAKSKGDSKPKGKGKGKPSVEPSSKGDLGFGMASKPKGKQKGGKDAAKSKQSSTNGGKSKGKGYQTKGGNGKGKARKGQRSSSSSGWWKKVVQ